MMKNKLRSNLLRYGIAAFLLANTFQTNAQLELNIDPAKSNGFTTWKETMVSSTLSIYEKVGSSYNLITSQTTTKDYIRIDPVYFNTPNYYYRIVGTRADNSTTETGYVPALPVGGTGYIEYGAKVCNGESYAYELLAFGNDASSNVRLKAQSTEYYYDPSNLTWIPYFQPVSNSVWTAMPGTHPYKTAAYKVVPIANYLIHLGDTVRYFDKQNNPVIDGYLVEKRFDQFEKYHTASTRMTADFPYNTSPNLTGPGSSWVGFFNSYVDTLTYNTPSFSAGNFVPTTVTGLECIESYTLPTDSGPGPIWVGWVDSMHKVIHDLEVEIENGFGSLGTSELEDLIHTIHIDSTDDIYVTGVTFKKYNATPYINLVKNGNTLDVHSVGSSIPAGLYEVNVFSNIGKVIPLYIDVKYAIPFSPLKNYATVSIAPNPIISNDLTVNIKNKKTGNISVKLYDINGNLLHTNSFKMTQKEVTKHYDISSYTLPSNQIIVKVSFLDGSFISVTGIR
ncbi:hypothetical protein D3C71_493580 [compost metagenome]